MAVMAIFYTGDKRHNIDIAKQNHQKLFDRLKDIVDINLYWFTKDDPGRGVCPFEEGDPALDNVYRRGQGGAVHRDVDTRASQALGNGRTCSWIWVADCWVLFP